MRHPLREAWIATATGLGLAPFFGPVVLHSLDFHWMKHALVPSGGASSEPTATNFFETTLRYAWWVHGDWRGAEVLAGIPFAHTGQMAAYEPLTVAVARVHPALLFGLRCRAPAPPHEPPLSAIDRARAEAVFARISSDGSTANDQVAKACMNRMQVNASDTAVLLRGAGVLHEQLPTMLDSAFVIARRLGEARRALPRSELEAAVAAEWRAFASLSNLEYDDESFLIRGRASGFEIAIALYARGFQHAVDLRVRLARSIDDVAFLSVRRTTKLDRVTRWLQQPSETGDAVFDRTFYIRGGPERAVRSMLTEPVRRAIDATLEWSEGVTLHRDTLWVHAATVLDRQELVPALASTLALANELTPVPRASPYR
jgi:hypothetical protein